MKHFILFLFTFVSCTIDNEQDYFSEFNCITDNIYYKTSNPMSVSIQSIVANKCLGCHYFENMAEVNYVVLEEYEQLLEIDIYAAINRPAENPMPPEGSSPLTECEKMQIESWLVNNAPYDEQGF